MVVVFTGGMMVAGVTAWHPCYFLLCLSTIASIIGHHTLLWRWSFVFTIPWCPLIYLPALEINCWVWSSAGLVGLKFTVRSANLLITLIIFNFFRSNPQGVLHVFRIPEFSTKENILFSFLSNLSHLYLSFHAFWNWFFWLERVFQMMC